MNEVWKGIKGYEGKYQISSFGRVKSLKDKYGNYREKILKQKKDDLGYYRINLYKFYKSKTFLVHRLVAEAFIENPNNYKEVNHRDENPSNNKVDNLEWCTAEYNVNYGTRNKRVSEKMKGRYKGSNHPKARKVQCVTTGKKFSCIKEAAEYYSINRKCISDCCRGKQKSAGKHPITGEKLVWKYID